VERRSIQRFQVVEQIGSGGMGAVYRAHDPQLERDVAIKVLHEPHAGARAELSTHRTVNLRARGATPGGGLLREARMMARLSHPNVVPIYEVGLDDADVFVVMEYVVGANLRGWLEAPRTTEEIVAAFAQAGRGLAAAHAHSIVHRDFKPDNVLLGADGRARVTDFGLSQLATSTGLVRRGERAGTPRYMAPELWDGEPASMRSDVYAFAASLVEALGGDARGEPAEVARVLRERLPAAPALRELVGRALAERPDVRPGIGELVAALEGEVPAPGPRPRRRRAVIAAGALAAGALGIGAALALDDGGGGDGPACADDPALLAGRWDDGKREALRASFSPASDPAERSRVVARFDARAAEVAQLVRATCAAAARGELTAEQAARRTGCLERRAIEIGAVAGAQLRAGSDTAAAEQRLNRVAPAAGCAELRVPPLGADRATLAALYDVYGWSADIASPTEAVDELAALERDARAAGDLELAARAAITLGIRLRNVDRHAESDQALQRAYRTATEIGSTEAAASALAERSWTLAQASELAEARSLIELAVDLAARPTTSPRARLRVHRVRGFGEKLRGDYRAAIETLQGALALTARSGQRDTDVELLARIDLTDSLILVGGRAREAVAYAHETLELARATAGEQAHNYSVTVGLVAKAYLLAGEPEKALAYRRQVLEAYLARYPADHSAVVYARGELGVSLSRVGDLDAARRELAEAVRVGEGNPAARRSLPWLTGQLALTAFALGRRDEAIRQHARAIEQMLESHPPDHPTTLEMRFDHGDLLLELGRLDEVAQIIDALEQAYRRRPEPRDRRPALLRGTLGADLALRRGRPRDAEALARRALEELAEAGAGEAELAIARRHLGESLVEQGRFADALGVLEDALAMARRQQLRDDALASFELALARAEHGAGRRDDAAARAARAAERVGRYPGQVRLRAEIARFVAAARRR
jgi:eukaryotic-like serine/threonine-protein kinase